MAELEARVEQLGADVQRLEGELAAARKHSGNSSKPPSSDITQAAKKPKKRGRPRKRTRGGQPGHPKHEREPFSPEEIDEVWEYRDDACPDCGGPLCDADEEPQLLQQVELPEKPVRITEHRGVAQCCRDCGRLHHAPLPDEVTRAGMVGPRLTALVAFLKGACHMSFSAIAKFFRDCLGVRISRGQLSKLVGKVSRSLQDPYDQLLALLPDEEVLNVDETGHKENGRRMWTWCFRASMHTLYKISPSRGSDVLLDVLGAEFNGVLGCDYFSAYRKYMRLNENVTLQFCLAHLIRDVKFLAEHPDRKNRAYGARLLAGLKKLFAAIHRREKYQSAATFERALGRVRDELLWNATMEAPATREAGNLADRFYQHFESYFRFITTPGVEPTNNLAERAIRFVAIHRRLTQGTRSETGQRWCEHIWTAIATCAQQDRSLFEFLCQSITALFHQEPAPTLLFDTS